VILGVVAVSLALLSCGGGSHPDPAEHPWVGTTVTDEGVTTVRTDSGSVWPGPARLIEELSIGEEIGEEPYMLGNIGAVAATDDRIYALDSQSAVVRVYNMAGDHLFDVGEGGQGPGELEQPSFMGLDRLGNVFVVGQGEIEIFSSEGDPLDTWSLEQVSRFSWFNTANVGLDGTVYIPVILEREGMNPATWKVGYTEFREGAGQITRSLPEFDYETPAVEIVRRTDEYVSVGSIYPAFVPRRAWAISAHGSIVAGSANKYRFHIHHADGRRMIVEKVWDPVPLERAEGGWHRDLLRADVADADETSGWDPDSMPPSHKPAFEELVPDEDGRIWAIRAGPGIRPPDCNEHAVEPAEFRNAPCWFDSALLDVFDEQGRYLGPVELPQGSHSMTHRYRQSRPFIRDDVVVVAIEDELGIIRIKLYRLAVPS
jgi:hypothetical protein